MKKLFLLMMGAGVSALSVNAQQAVNKSMVFDSKYYTAKLPVEPAKKLVKPVTAQSSSKNTANKTTANPRWYSYFNDVDAFNGNVMSQGNLRVIPMWFDSTVLQTFSSGDNTINYSSASLFMDPSRYKIYNDIGLHAGEMQISATDAYTVDSIKIAGVYEENTSRPSTIVDTLILSVAPSTGRYALNKNTYAWAAPYLAGSQKDTLYAFTIYNVDSVNRAAFSDVTTVSRIMWKEPLTAAMRDTGFNIKEMTFKVPGGLNVPAGNAFSITVTFKSGDTWTPNVSNVEDFHRFMPLSGFIAANTAMPYYYYSHDDRNMSSMMFSTDTGTYLPAVIIEGINTTAYSYEFHDFDAYILCPTCSTVGSTPPPTSANDIKAATVGDAYPNPATNMIAIPFTTVEAANVNVTITNAVGATVAAQELGKFNANQSGKAIFNVGDYANGVYFYTVEANGQRVTKRFVITH